MYWFIGEGVENSIDIMAEATAVHTIQFTYLRVATVVVMYSLMGMVAEVTANFGPFCSKDFSSDVSSFFITHCTNSTSIMNPFTYKNHGRFTLRCIGKDLLPVSVRLKSTSNNGSRRAREKICKTEKQLLQDRIKCINGILHENAIKLDRSRSRLLSIVTITMDKCADFIKKVR